MAIQGRRLRRRWWISFPIFWLGQATLFLSSMLVEFALIWWLIETSDSSEEVLLTAAMMSLLPALVVGPFAGALVDRCSRRAVMILSALAIALATGLAISLILFQALRIWHVYLVLFVRSVGGTFHSPALASSTSLMVPSSHISGIAGVNQMLYGVVSFVSPLLGAFLLGVRSLPRVLSLELAGAAVAIAVLLAIAIPEPRERARDSRTAAAVWQDVRGGLGYLWRWRGLFIALVLMASVNFLLSPALSLLPVLVTKHLAGGRLELGQLKSAIGIGAIIGGAVLGLTGGFRRRAFTALTGVAGIGIGILTVGLTPTALPGLVWGSLFVVGFMSPIANGPLMAVVHAKVAPEMQGRVFTAMESVASVMAVLGVVVASPVAGFTGPRIWYVAAGIACLLMGAGGFSSRSLRQVDDQDAPPVDWARSMTGRDVSDDAVS